MKNPTKVVLLQVASRPHIHASTHTTPTQNMVGPGDVDEDLEPETAEECAKYGTVGRCLIYEVSECSIRYSNLCACGVTLECSIRYSSSKHQSLCMWVE